MMRVSSLALGALLLVCAPAGAEEPMLGPAIEGYGPTYPIEDRDVPVESGTVYKAVFDAARYSDDLSTLNTRLVSVARFLNMHVRNGTPLERMDLAVVLHGQALKTVFNNDAYEARYGIANPNLELVHKLAAAGVDFYVCGQSMAFDGYAKSELAGPARVALSAMTMLTELQNQGYALIP
jgi:intracellular sulfur oxidation DsrE/DsrF family protein